MDNLVNHVPLAAYFNAVSRRCGRFKAIQRRWIRDSEFRKMLTEKIMVIFNFFLAKLTFNLMEFIHTEVSPSWMPPISFLKWRIYTKPNYGSIRIDKHRSHCRESYLLFLFATTHNFQRIASTACFAWHGTDKTMNPVFVLLFGRQRILRKTKKKHSADGRQPEWSESESVHPM